MTGDRTAHPLLISLANILADFHMKSTHNAFVLLALLPVPKFLEKKQENPWNAWGSSFTRMSGLRTAAAEDWRCHWDHDE